MAETSSNATHSLTPSHLTPALFILRTLSALFRSGHSRAKRSRGPAPCVSSHHAPRPATPRALTAARTACALPAGAAAPPAPTLSSVPRRSRMPRHAASYALSRSIHARSAAASAAPNAGIVRPELARGTCVMRVVAGLRGAAPCDAGALAVGLAACVCGGGVACAGMVL
jgi:hypothetical protein